MTLLAVARLDLASDRSDAARSALDEAETICSQLGARPALAEIVACRETLPSRPSDGGLSAREQEVLRLVSEGLTDREVAERLYVSPRTINQHLRSIYNKLGVNSRTAATRIALERGIV
jgi:DNA-binding NarL/FixJ family response regulator